MACLENPNPLQKRHVMVVFEVNDTLVDRKEVLPWQNQMYHVPQAEQPLWSTQNIETFH